MKIEKCYLQGGGWVLLREQDGMIEGHERAASRGRRFPTRAAAAARMRDEEAAIEAAGGQVRRVGRPLLGESRRLPLRATIDPATSAAIDADRRPGEGRGQVLDRWAQDRAIAGA